MLSLRYWERLLGECVEVAPTLGVSLVPAAMVLLGFLAYAILSGAGQQPDTWRPRSSKGRRMRRVGTLAAIRCYPIKGCSGIKLPRAYIDNAGVRPVTSATTAHCAEYVHDRLWVLLDAAGRTVSSTHLVGMVFVSVDPAAPGQLIVTGKGMEAALRVRVVTAPREEDLAVKEVKTSSREAPRPVPVVDCGEEAAAWFSKCLEMPGVRLYQSAAPVSTSDFDQRDYSGLDAVARRSGRAHFASLSHCLGVSNQSLAHLNAQIDTGTEVVQDVFRPNLVFDAQEGPYAEETWQEVFIGRGDTGDGVSMEFFEVAPRCVIVTMDPATGAKDPHYEPMRSLRRRGETRPFGVRLVLLDGGEVRVGDPIYALKRPRDSSS